MNRYKIIGLIISFTVAMILNHFWKVESYSYCVGVSITFLYGAIASLGDE